MSQGGRDPLGLSRVSMLITDYLLTGIITQTDRARYYSFYCWVLWHIQQEEEPHKYADFVERFRRREAAFTLATLADDEESSLVGVRAARPQYDKGKAHGEFNCNFKILPSNELGAYGQYYAGSLYDLGLTHRLEDGVDRVTVGAATELAQLFQDTIKRTPYIRDGLFKKSLIDADALRRTGKHFNLNALSKTFAAKEKQQLIALFFGLDQKNPDERTLLRRDTLTHILRLVSEYQKQRQTLFFNDIDWYLVYPVYYYDVLLLDRGKTIAYECPDRFSTIRVLWRQFCLHQFITYALESLLSCVLDVCGGDAVGLSLSDTATALLQKRFHTVLTALVGQKCKKPSDLLRTLGISSKPDDKISAYLRKQISVMDERSEMQTVLAGFDDPQEGTARAMLLLSILYGKWQGWREEGRAFVFQHVHSNDLWANTVLPQLDAWLDTALNWEQAIIDLITMLIRHHDMVMYDKGRLDRSWISLVDGRVIKDQDYSPRLRASRHANAVSILCDLGPLTLGVEREISITPEGRTLLGKLLK